MLRLVCLPLEKAFGKMPPSPREVSRQSRDGRSFTLCNTPSVTFGDSSLKEGACFGNSSAGLQSAQLADFIAQIRRLFKFELGGRGAHFLGVLFDEVFALGARELFPLCGGFLLVLAAE